MRLSEFWSLMEEEFGATYAHTLARTQVVQALGGRTPSEALATGVPAREVWLALCDAMEVPAERRLGQNRAQRSRRG